MAPMAITTGSQYLIILPAMELSAVVMFSTIVYRS